MGEVFISPVCAYADGTGFNVTSSNSSGPVDAPVKTVNFDKDASFYDMRGHKYMIILNHYIFEDTIYFKVHPNERTGTIEDELRLQQVFTKLGFLLFVRRDYRYMNIINFLRAFAASDHTRTSCICVTILTHGDKGGQVFAADRPYLLNEVMNIFLKQESLTNKPKLFFVQACRGDYMDSGHAVSLSSQFVSVIKSSRCDSTLIRPNYHSSDSPVYYAASKEKVYMIRKVGERADARVFSSFLFKLYQACRDFWYAGNTGVTPPDSQNPTTLTVPTHADSLVLRSTVENYRSWRDVNGSWMIQVLCGIIEEHHKDLNLVDMIIKMNRTVAYNKISYNCPCWEMNDKKQIPETSITLTKHLKFETVLR